MMTSHRTTIGLAGLSLAAMLALPVNAAEEIRGFIADAGGTLPGANATHFTLHIDQISPDDEVIALATILKEKGQDALLKQLWHTKEKGWLRVGTNLGYHVAIIRSFKVGEERVVRAITDRPIQFWEVFRGLRTEDYSLGVIEVRLDAQGKGEGTLIAAALVKFDAEGKLEIESYGTHPFKLLQLKTEQVKD
jgi:hypothetical protein